MLKTLPVRSQKPYTRLRGGSTNHCRRLWLNQFPKQICRQLDSRNQLFGKYKTTESDADGIQFRRIRNKCKQAIHQLGHNSQTKLLQRSHSKVVLIKYIRHLRTNRPSVSTLKLKNGTLPQNALRSPSCFANFSHLFTRPHS